VSDPVLTRRGRLPAALILGGALACGFVLLAVIAPLLPLPNPDTGGLAGRLQPLGTPGHLLGTDGQGRDLLVRLIVGTQPSLITGIVPVVVSGTLGTALGIAAGMGVRWLENAIMRSLDVLFAFPAVLLAIAVAASLGASLTSLIVGLSVILVPAVARVVHSEVAGLRSLDFVQTARASGASSWVIATRHVLPNILPAVAVYCSALIGLSIVVGAGLSFLGLGVAPPQAEWGAMLNDLRQNLFSTPSLAIAPAVAIFVAAAVFNLLGEGLRGWFDVTSRWSA